jgi:8-oxo-dGTP diphosphatase/2-hydroxy-dATP diphosphatase
LYEETSLQVEHLEKIAELKFTFQTGELLLVHAYKVLTYEGEPIESEEMKPQWWPIINIPYLYMWPDDLYWLPQVLKGKKVIGDFLFADQNILLDYDIEVVKSFI